MLNYFSRKFLTSLLVVLLLGGFVVTKVITKAPEVFPAGTTFVVNENETLFDVSKRLEEENIIRSSLLFRAWISFLGKDRHMQLGLYTFETPMSLSEVVGRVIYKGPDNPLVRLTIPEGSTTKEIAQAVHGLLPQISAQAFMEEVTLKNAEGKLFPSTYFLLPSTNEKRLVEILTDTFTKTYEGDFGSIAILPPLTSKDDVVTLASILEGEANTVEGMEIVSGILQKRLTLGMPLQVDVEPSTYKKKGLPAHPVNNPGQTSLFAALHPRASPYLYYITGTDGTMYYAKTFAEHKANIKKYLRK